MKNSLLILAVVAATIGIVAFKDRPVDIAAKKPVDLANFDNKTRPQDDFYQYVNGNWLKNNPVPASESRWAAFSEVNEYNYAILRKVLEEAAANKAAVKGSNEQKIGDFYATGMDSVKLNKDGMKPLKVELAQIDAIKTQNDLIKTITDFTKYFSNPLFQFYATQDAKNSSVVVPHASQGGIGLPDRDYYFKDDAKSKSIREAYKIHIQKLFELAGNSEDIAKSKAAVVYSMEEELAQVSMGRVERRDPERTYNKKLIHDMSGITPDFDWKLYLMGIGIYQQSYIIIDNPNFFMKMNKMLSQHSIEDWKAFLQYNVIAGGAPFLSDAWINESFSFNEKMLKGTKEIKPRWKRVLQTVDGLMGQPLGELYCNQAFKPETKKRCLEMVNNLGVALKQRISQLDWMDNETKAKAQLKLSMFMKKIGYPDKWRDYSGLSTDRASYYNNVRKASAFSFQYMISKIGKPIDKTEWLMSPPTVNAYYNPSMNEIVFPAGILQPPFYNANADDAVNYGGIGAVIGHEMTHGFDDEGRKFDAEGNLTNWWTTNDSAKFMAKANLVKEQFNNYTVLDTMHVNGELTLGENIADLGGITISYEAFKMSLIGKPAPAKIDGFTAEQRFFIGWAQVWRQNIREEEMRRRLIVDPHSPGKLRCNGPLSNLPEFYEAFDVKPGDKMYRHENERARIW